MRGALLAGWLGLILAAKLAASPRPSIASRELVLDPTSVTVTGPSLATTGAVAVFPTADGTIIATGPLVFSTNAATLTTGGEVYLFNATGLNLSGEDLTNVALVSHATALTVQAADVLTVTAPDGDLNLDGEDVFVTVNGNNLADTGLSVNDDGTGLVPLSYSVEPSGTVTIAVNVTGGAGNGSFTLRDHAAALDVLRYDGGGDLVVGVDLIAADQVIADDLQADTITDEAGTGAPTLSQGAVVADTKAIACAADGGCAVGASGTEFGTAWVQTLDDGDGTVSMGAALDMGDNGIVNVGSLELSGSVTMDASTYSIGNVDQQLKDLWLVNDGRIYLSATEYVQTDAATGQLRFQDSATDMIDFTSASSQIRADETVGNLTVAPGGDNMATLGRKTQRWSAFYMGVKSAPETIASTSIGTHWFTESVGPYGASNGCEQSGCISTSFLYFDNEKWRRVDGELTNLASSAAAVTLPIGRSLLADTSANAMAVSIVGCTAARDGQQNRVKLYAWDASNDIVTITPASGTIDGAANKILSNLGDSVDLTCYGAGTDWYSH